MKYLRLFSVVIVLLTAIFFLQQWNSGKHSPSETFHDVDREETFSRQPVSANDFSVAWKVSSRGDEARATLIQQAENRRDQFMKLMAGAPSDAIKRSISIRDYVNLPAELRPYFEQPLNAIGDVDLIWETSDTAHHGRHCQHQNTVKIDGTTYMAYGADRHMLPVTNQSLVSGIRLGNMAVIQDSGVRRLTKDEVKAAATLFPVADNWETDPVTHQPSHGGPVALVAGEIYQFETEELLNHVEQMILEAKETADRKHQAKVDIPFEWITGNVGGDADPEGAGADNTPYQEEQIEVLYIRVDFSDFPGAPISKADLETTLNTVNGHIANYSYNKAGITYTVSDTVYRMPSTGASYALAGNNTGIQTDARALAGGDFTLADYDVIAVYFPNIGSSNVPGSNITYGGRASIGGSNHWVNGVNSVGVILHEFGHNYGLYHANYYHPEQSLGGTYQLPGSLEYGDIFDEMGNGNSPEAHFSHLAKNYMQWMPDSKVAEASGDATYTIYRFDDVNALSNPLLAVKVPMSGSVNYWIGYRQLYTSSSYNLDEAAYVVAENLAQNRETSLIDMTPESESSEANDRRDAGLPVGGTYYDSSSGVRFNALERGGSAPNQWIKVQVLFDPRISVAEANLSVDEQCGVARVVVQRSFSSSGSVSVDYTTSNGSASVGDDYYATSGTLTWQDGDSSDKTIIIPIRPDVLAEGIETLSLTLSNVSGGVLDPELDEVTVNILDAGQRITSFTPPFFNVSVQAIAPLDDGRVMIGGEIYSVSGYPDIKNIARLNADGSVDTTFVSGTGFNDEVEVIVVQPDGEYLIGGQFTSYNSTACNRLVRLNSDGTIDGSFVTAMGSAADATVHAIAIESNGQILVGGEFDTFKGSAANGLVRLNASGAPASPLSLPFNANAAIYSLIVEPGGKVVVAGNFSLPNTGNGTHRDIVRLHSSGSRDTSFDAGSGSNGGVHTIARHSDGKYTLGGYFSTYNGVSASRCCRVNNNGSIDATFTAPAFNSSVLDALVQSDGKTIVGGWFSSPGNRLDRLTATGSIDSTFMQGTGPGGSVYALATDSAGSVWVGGNFYSYNGISCRPVIRLAGGESPYDLWANTRFSVAQFSNGESDPDSDPDGDGMINLVEMAMGTNPNLANSDPVFGVSQNGGITLHNSGGQSYLQLSLDKTALEKGAWYVAQFSSDLVVWSPASPSPAANASYEVIENSATTFIVRDKTAISPSAPRFGRIVIKQPE